MSVTAVIGAQWGDEGKGKIVDLLAQDADMVVRFNGGNNAGHTIVNEIGEFKLHIIPAGIFNMQTLNIVGAGCAVHAPTFVQELNELIEAGVQPRNLLVSAKAHLVMPWHVMLDEAQEKKRSRKEELGTTRRGIGPVFSDKYARRGLRAGDLLVPSAFKRKFYDIYDEKKRELVHVYDYDGKLPSAKKLYDEYMSYALWLADFIEDVEKFIWQYADDGMDILLEGAQAVLLGINHGTYPFVTSSDGGVSDALAGSGLNFKQIDEVIAVVKAYSTRIGAGAFPTKATPQIDELLRTAGNEYGATTGRPRMCGWLDLPLLRYASRLNGFTSFAVTKLDILNELDEIKVGTGYKCSEKKNTFCKHAQCGLNGRPARLETVDNWHNTKRTSQARHREDLPDAANAYVELIEEVLRCPAKFISVGPHRDSTIHC